MKTMPKHFLKIAPQYRDLRTTDSAPIEYIYEQLKNAPRSKEFRLFELEEFEAFFRRVPSSSGLAAWFVSALLTATGLTKGRG